MQDLVEFGHDDFGVKLVCQNCIQDVHHLCPLFFSEPLTRNANLVVATRNCRTARSTCLRFFCLWCLSRARQSKNKERKHQSVFHSFTHPLFWWSGFLFVGIRRLAICNASATSCYSRAFITASCCIPAPAFVVRFLANHKCWRRWCRNHNRRIVSQFLIYNCLRYKQECRKCC